MNRTALSLLAGAAGLAAVTGVTALQLPSDSPAGPGPAAARLPVERSALTCPPPADSDLAKTEYTALTPVRETGTGEEAERPADLLPAERADDGTGDSAGGQDGGDGADDGDSGEGGDSGDSGEGGDGAGDGENGPDDGGPGGDRPAADPVLSVQDPGAPVTAAADGPQATALFGTADGPLAPGWTVQQTTTVGGESAAVLGTACTAPDTEFWFPGASTAEERQDYIHLTNPDSTSAVVDLDLYGEDGAVDTESGQGITVPGYSTVPVLLSSLTDGPVADVTVHAKVRTGRVGAQVHAVDEQRGRDWLPPAAEPASRAVLPGIPEDATSLRLVAFAPERDADLDVRLAGASGTFTPAGLETLHVKGGMLTAVDVDDLTRGEAGSLVLSPAEDRGDDAAPVVAALRVVRGEGSKQELAFIPGTEPVDEQATAADNRGKGSTLSLMASGSSVRVKVVASSGSEKGSSAEETYTVEAGTTKAVEPPVPDGVKGRYGLTVLRVSGGTLHAARTLELPDGGVPRFTVQTLPDDRGTVQVPAAEQDLSVLTGD